MFESYLSVLRYLRQVWLRRWLAVFIAVAGSLAGWALVIQLQDVYRADTRLYVDTTSMLDRVLSGVALDSSDVDAEFLRVTRRSLLSRPNLERIARDTDLELEAVTPEAREQLLNNLAASIIIRGESTTRRGQENLFQLAYDHPDPARALEVVRTVHDLFIESVLGLSQQDLQKMDSFLERQIAEYERRLEQAEDRRRAFRQQNAGLLPGEGQNYFSMLHAGRERLREAELNLKRAQRLHDDLRTQLAGMAVEYSEEELVGSEMTTARGGSLAQMQSLELQLGELQSRYTDQHPDVVSVRRRLEQLRVARGLAPDGSLLDGDEAASRNEAMGRMQVQGLRAELARAQAQVASERAVVEEYQERLAGLEASVHTIPEVEAEMARLNRDYNIIRRQYEELVSRRESAHMSREADLAADGGMFRVIEPPHVSSQPIRPDRPLLLSLVFGGAIAAGGGLTFLLSLLRATYGDLGQLRKNTGVPVLGRVGKVRSRGEIWRRRFGHLAFGSLASVLLAAYLFLLLQYA